MLHEQRLLGRTVSWVREFFSDFCSLLLAMSMMCAADGSKHTGGEVCVSKNDRVVCLHDNVMNSISQLKQIARVR